MTRFQFDVLAISDLRFPGGTAAAIAHEIRALNAAGYSVGLLHKAAPVLKKKRPINPAVRACIDGGQAVLVEATTGPVEIGAKLAVLHNPLVFTEAGYECPRITADRKVMVAHQPLRDSNGVQYYDAEVVQKIAEALVGDGVTWAPISPLSRINLVESGIRFDVLPEDWTNVIFTGDWEADRREPAADKPVIGRHSRPEWQKWPASREEVLAVYPDCDEFDVRLLGVDETLKRIVGEPLPSNWTAFGFGEIEPAEFLRTIDFFAYYHHPAWVEAFGRTIAEAAASGAVVILPEHFEPTFGDAALYRRPDEVLDTARTLYADWDEYRLQSRLGQRVIERLYGPTRYLDRIAGLIGKPELGDAPAIRSEGVGRENVHLVSQTTAIAEKQFDVVQLGDLRTKRDTAWRIANETRIQAESGYSTGLIHVETAGPERLEVINPVIDGLTRDGSAEPVNPSTPLVKTKLLIVNEPDALLYRVLAGGQIAIPRILAEKVVAIPSADSAAGNLQQQDSLLKAMFGDGVNWAATNSDWQQTIATQGVQPDGEIWKPAIPASALNRKPRGKRLTAVVGVVAPEPARLSEDEDLRADRSGARVKAVFRVLPVGKMDKAALRRIPDGWEVCAVEESDPGKELDKLDLIVYVPEDAGAAAEANLILAAMGRGVPAVVPGELKWFFGNGPIYGGWREAFSLLDSLDLQEELFSEIGRETARRVSESFGPGVHRARLQRLVGPAATRSLQAPRLNSPQERRRVLFASSNGVGLGHLTRLLAIARRMGPEFEPVFATLSQAVRVVEQAGYPVEYLPYHAYANCDVNDWNGWFAQHLSQILDFHRPRAVVFDGGMPYSGLIQAVTPRPDVKFVWVRRGMWKAAQDNREAIARQRCFDLIIEPSDIAEAVDRGATASNRHAVLKVAPISLLDADELVDRPTAAARLGLDPERPAVLIQLGSGWNRDLVSMMDAILRALAGRPDVQPVILEWLIAGTGLDLWPGVRRLSGFPVAKYYNAFDFTISAAGYNSFNEIISFGVPAIFVASEHAMLDDQQARAEYADENCAAFSLGDKDLQGVERVVDLMLDEKVRWLVKANCSRLSKGNGAGEAAQAIAELIS